MYAAAITCFKENIVNYLRKLLLGKMYIWEVAAWEKAFEKVPNITPGITAS